MSFHRTFRALWAALSNVTCITWGIIIHTPLITVFALVCVVDFITINHLITLVCWCEGNLTIPTAHISLPILPWRGIEGGVPLRSPQRLQGRAAAPQRTLVSLYRQPTGCAAGLAANHWWRGGCSCHCTGAVAGRIVITGVVGKVGSEGDSASPFTSVQVKGSFASAGPSVEKLWYSCLNS